MRNITPIVQQLIIINVIFFIGSELVAAAKPLFSLFYFENPNFQIWQPLTSMFMHGGVMHILFNMFALFSFGSTLEQIWGSKKFLTFYILCGLGAAGLHLGVNYYQFHEGLNTLALNGISNEYVYNFLNSNEIGRYEMRWLAFLSQEKLDNMLTAYHSVTLGASGAIYGLLVAFAFMFPNAGLMLLFIPFPVKAKYFVPGILLIDLYLGVSGGGSIFGGSTGIAHFAHLGGAAMGILLMYYFKKTQFNQNRWDR